MAKLEGFLSFRRQPEVICEYFFLLFFFRESFPHLLSVLCNLFHVTFQFLKIIDERMTAMTVNKDRKSILICGVLIYKRIWHFSNCCFIFLYSWLRFNINRGHIFSLAIKLLMNSISNNCEFNWHCAVIRFVPHIFGLLLSMLTDLNLVWGGDWTRDRDLVFPNVFIFLLQVTTQLTGYPWGKGKWHWIFFWWPLFCHFSNLSSFVFGFIWQWRFS